MPQYKSTSVRTLAALLLICVFLILPNTASATITQGDFSIFGNFRTKWAGRFGEGSVRNPKLTSEPPSARGGGPFTFDRWDLVEAKQEVDLRPDYHFIKNYNFLGRLDTLFVKEADFFAIYRAWYDAEGDFKPKGTAQAARDFPKYTQREKIEKYARNDLREYYAEIDVSDNLAFRVGKQQIIWSEADALSGTEVLNPADLRYHFIHFEAPEDQRKNINMIKMDYVLGDIWKSANNQLEAFWIPGDIQATSGGAALAVNVSDARDPYALTYSDARANGVAPLANQEGVLEGGGTFHDGNLSNATLDPVVPGQPVFLDFIVKERQSFAHHHGLDKSEFGARYSTLLPIGNGLQMGLIYEYLYRAETANIDPFGPHPPCLDAGTCIEAIGPDVGSTGGVVPLPPALTSLLPGGGIPTVQTSRGVYGVINTVGCDKGFQERPGGIPMGSLASPLCPGKMRIGQVYVDVYDKLLRSSWFGLTGTYYDKDLLDVVYRYDFAYRPHVGYNHATPATKALDTGPSGLDYGSWTDEFIGVIAGDRPTYLPWISKQHTFIVAQWTTNWFISAHGHDIPTIVSPQGKLRKYQNVAFVAAANWLFDGRLVTTNVIFWDIDTMAGFLGSTNLFRYSRNVLLGLNLQWYMGASGKYTDPFTMSRDQRISEVEFKFGYEL